MKKIFSFVIALVACALTFTSCEKKADVNQYPFVGHTFVGTDESGTAQLLFRDDFTVVTTVLTTGNRATYDWRMSNNIIELCLQSDMYFPAFEETHPKGWVVYSGPYDPTAKTITLKDHFVGLSLVYHQAD